MLVDTAEGSSTGTARGLPVVQMSIDIRARRIALVTTTLVLGLWIGFAFAVR